MLALDFLLVLLTSACIIYCMVLNRRIIQIQKYRAEMLKIFKEFDKSIEKAESILEETKKIAPKADNLLQTLEKRAEKQMDDLEFLLNKGDKLAEELETIIISGNKLIVRFTEAKDIEYNNYNILQQKIMTDDDIVEYDEEIVINENVKPITLTQQDYYKIIQKKRRHRK